MALEEIDKKIKTLERIYENARKLKVSDRFLDRIMNDLQHLKFVKDGYSRNFHYQKEEKDTQR